MLNKMAKGRKFESHRGKIIFFMCLLRVFLIEFELGFSSRVSFETVWVGQKNIQDFSEQIGQKEFRFLHVFGQQKHENIPTIHIHIHPFHSRGCLFVLGAGWMVKNVNKESNQ